MPTQRPPGKIATRAREIVSTPPKRALQPLASTLTARGDRRRESSARRAAPTPAAVPFEFGGVAVNSVAGGGAAGPKAEQGPGAPVEAGAVPAHEPEVRSKVPGQAAPEPAPAVAVVPIIAAPATAADALMGAAASPVAEPESAVAGASPSAAEGPVPAAAGQPGALEGPPSTSPARAPAPWSQVFRGMSAVAQALLARIDASRGEHELPQTPATGPAGAGKRVPIGGTARSAAGLTGALDGLRAIAAEVAGWSVEARLGAASAERRADAAGALPFGAEASRIGQAARVVGATLATIRIARASRSEPSARARAFEERVTVRRAVLDNLLARLRAGDPVPRSAVDVAVAAALAEAQGFFQPADRLGRTGVLPLFAATDEIGRALDTAGRLFAGPDAKGSAAPVEARLERAAANAAEGADVAAEISAPPVNATARALREEGEELAAADREKPLPQAPKVRPPAWELRVARTSVEVGVADIARALGVAKLADVRDVLLQGLATRHQFVLWTQVGTELEASLKALIDEGLVETRIQAP